MFLMEGMWTRFFPAAIKVRELIESGTHHTTHNGVWDGHTHTAFPCTWNAWRGGYDAALRALGSHCVVIHLWRLHCRRTRDDCSCARRLRVPRRRRVLAHLR